MATPSKWTSKHKRIICWITPSSRNNITTTYTRISSSNSNLLFNHFSNKLTFFSLNFTHLYP